MTQFEWNGDEISARIHAAAGDGVGKALEHLLEESRRLVPIEEGTLERSGAVSRDGLRGAVSYDTVYAARQHEEMDWRHDPGRQAKYLEQPFVTGRIVLLGIIAQEIRDGIGT